MGSITIIIRAILLFLSLVSFIPQYRLIRSKRDCSGISLSYVLFNLIAFTEQFALGLHFILESFDGGDSVIHIKPTVGDWLNLCQHTLVWICYLVLFILCLSCQPERPGQKYTVSAIYVSFLLISVAPVIFELSYITEQDIRWVMAFFSHYHTIYINPIVTIICFASLFPQARETLSRPSPGTLSITGLAIQAVIFAVVALYWPWRITPSREHLELPPLRRFITWYQLDGWATVDNTVFAFVQAVLLWIAVRRRSVVQAVTTDETTPLLQD